MIFTYYSGATTSITNSTISGNTASDAGGGIRNFDGLTQIFNSTITDNQAAIGGGVASYGKPDTRTELSSTIVAGNTATTSGKDVSSESESVTDNSFVSLGNNLIGDGEFQSVAFFTNGTMGDQVGTAADPLNPMLGPLADNGGPTLTHALLPGSPAIDAGNNGLAVDPDGNTLTTDQRGDGFPRVVSGTVDMGSLEASAASARNLLVQVASNGTDIVVTDGNNEISRFTAPFDNMSVAGGDLDDTITIADLSSLITGVLPITINGGGGSDRVILQSSGQTLDATAHSITSVEVIDIRGSGDNGLILSEDQVDNLPDSGQTLRVNKDPTNDVTFTTGNFAVTGSTTQDSVVVIEAASESATIQFTGTEWSNPIDRSDVNGVDGVTASDAITIINQLNNPTADFYTGPSALIDTEQLSVPFPLFFFDVSGDGNLTASDALQIINLLNARVGGPEPMAAGELTQVVGALDLVSDSVDQEEPSELDTLIDLSPQSKWVNPADANASSSTPSAIQIGLGAETSGTESAADAQSLKSQLSERAMDEWFADLGRR